MVPALSRCQLCAFTNGVFTLSTRAEEVHCRCKTSLPLTTSTIFLATFDAIIPTRCSSPLFCYTCVPSFWRLTVFWRRR